MGIPVLSTPTLFNTANLLYTLANRIQKKKQDRISIQHKPKLITQKDWQVYVVASLPSIGDELAERLLKHFGSVRKTFQANISDLMKVEGVGKVKARKIKDILDKKF
jgi:ERCC4-type nuclease